MIKLSPGSNHRTCAFFHNLFGSLPAGINHGMEDLFPLIFVLPAFVLLVLTLSAFVLPFQAVCTDRYLRLEFYGIIIQHLQVFRLDPVITVNVCNILPCCQAKPCVSGPGQPPVFLVHDADPGILPCIPVAHLPTSVRLTWRLLSSLPPYM